MNNRNRHIGLDVLRLILALMVFGLHSGYNLQCTYGCATDFVSRGSMAMSGFFLLSGYVLFLAYKERNLLAIKEAGRFYVKRLVTIIPIYYLIAVLYAIVRSHEPLGDHLYLALYEVTGLQTVFSGLFSFSHNGSTWFISCLLLCYLLYPFIQEMSRQFSNKGRIIAACALTVLVIWAPFVQSRFALGDVYTNPFFRILEFSVGVLIAQLNEQKGNDDVSLRVVRSGCFLVVDVIILVACVSMLRLDSMMKYNSIAMPLFALALFSIDSPKMQSGRNFKVLSYCCKISYPFFLVQNLLWPGARIVLDIIGHDGNGLRIGVYFIVCVVGAAVTYEVAGRPFIKLYNRFASKRCVTHIS